MANVKFSQFSNANPLTGSDYLVGLQTGVNIKATLSQVATFCGSSVTLQTAYNNNPHIVLTNGFPINITDSSLLVAMNLDPGSQKLYTDYTIEATTAGYTSHLINQSIISSLTITQQQLDRTNINNSTNNYVWTFPTSDSFDLGSTVTIVQQVAGGSIQLVFPTGVFLNGVQNTSIIVNVAYQNVTVRKIGAQQYMTVFLSTPPTLQSVYNSSPSPVGIILNSSGFTFTNTSSTGTSFFATDNSSTALVGSFRTVINPNDEGSGGAWAQERFFGQSTFNSNLLQATWTYGFNYESVSGQESSYIALSILTQGNARNILNLKGFDGTYGTQASWNNLSSFNIGTLIPKPSALFQIASTTQGFLPPILNNSQELTLTGFLGSGDIGLQWFNSTTLTNNYWTGSAFNQALAIQNLNAGANVTLDKSVPGVVTINASGGGSAPLASYASWAIQNNPITTSISTSFVPIAVPPDGSGFFNVATSQFTNQLIGAPTLPFTTVVSTYTASNTQFFLVTGSVSGKNTTGSSQSVIFNIGILKANNTIVTTPFLEQIDFPSNPPAQNLSTTVLGIVELSQGDSVFMQIRNSSSSSGFVGTFIDFNISNIAGSIPSTNALSQGSSNLYLSQNGGTTYQYLNGVATIGDIPQFNSVGGQFINSGIAASSILKYVLVTGTTQQIAMNTSYIVKSSSTVTFTLPPTNSSIGIFEITGTGLANWIVNENSGQFILFNGISSTTSSGSAFSSTPYDSARFSYSGDGSGQFNITFSNGNEINLS